MDLHGNQAGQPFLVIIVDMIIMGIFRQLLNQKRCKYLGKDCFCGNPFRCVYEKINKYFILSFVVTTIICVVVLFFISERINKSLEYSISSSFTLQTNNEALTSQVYDVSDITVRNNDLIFDFIVSNLNDRDVKYEIMVLLNNQLKENAFENEQAVKNMEIQKSNSQMSFWQIQILLLEEL